MTMPKVDFDGAGQPFVDLGPHTRVTLITRDANDPKNWNDCRHYLRIGNYPLDVPRTRD